MPTEFLLHNIEKISIQTTLIATAVILVLLFLSAVIKNETETQKKLLFWPMVVAILANTIFISGATIWLNLSSFTKGPVHWHAAFELYGCGERIELVDPKGFSNKIGSPVLHEHNDNWIHLEGVPLTPKNASVGQFFENVGIVFSDAEFKVPTDSGDVIFKNGDLCGNEPGQAQAFVYTFERINGKQYRYTQKKFADAQEVNDYVTKNTGNIPPGDCLVFEFDNPKDKTDKLCKVYEAARARGELTE